MDTQVISEAAIRALATPESFLRGQEYFGRGAVLRLSRRGTQLEADVQGSETLPYRVRVTLQSGEIEADCTCPYDWGGICKHSVAALLALREPAARIEERPTVDSLLTGLERNQLQTLLLALVARHPRLADEIEAHATPSTQPAAPPVEGAPSASPGSPAVAATATPLSAPPASLHRSPPVAGPYRRRMRAALRAAGSDYDDYGAMSGVVAALDELLDEVWPLIQAGDGRGAIVLLEAVTDEYLSGWTDVDDSNGEGGDAFRDLGVIWTEAILSADLAPDERTPWAARFADWQRELDDYGVDEAFDAAQRAAREGWDDPDLQRVLDGHAGPLGVGEPRPPSWAARTLAEARLRVLARQGRTAAYLRLAAAEGLVVEQATMLARLGRSGEAEQAALAGITTPDEARAIAEALHRQGATAAALRVAERGMTFGPPPPPARSTADQAVAPMARTPAAAAAGAAETPYGPTGFPARGALARWLRDAAGEAGETARALEAAVMVVQERPTLEDFLAIAPLAGERWPTVREEALASLRRGPAFQDAARVDIFLHEGLAGDAIAIVDAIPYPTAHHYELIERVARAAMHSHPDWVGRTARRHVDRIADGGKSHYYAQAAEWLAIAGEAARVAGQEADWRTYVDDLLQRHARKRSLVPRLQRVRASAS